MVMMMEAVMMMMMDTMIMMMIMVGFLTNFYAHQMLLKNIFCMI